MGSEQERCAFADRRWWPEGEWCEPPREEDEPIEWIDGGAMREELVRAIESAGEDEESWVTLGHWVDMSMPVWGGVYPFCSVTDGVWFWPWTHETSARGWSVAGYVWIDFSSMQPIEFTVEFGETMRASATFGSVGLNPRRLTLEDWWLRERCWGRLNHAVRWVAPTKRGER